MGDWGSGPLSLELVAYRLAQTEIMQRAIQVELHDLRAEREQFVKQAELDQKAALRREWPVNLAAITVALAALASLALQLAHA